MRKKFILARKSLGLDQTEIGKSLGVTRWTIYNWEKGIYMPSAANIATIRKFFDNNDVKKRSGISTDSIIKELLV